MTLSSRKWSLEQLGGVGIHLLSHPHYPLPWPVFWCRNNTMSSSTTSYIMSIDCLNLTTSQTTFHLENLKPESCYNISLAGVTSVGPGPKATIIVNTYPTKQPGGHLILISLGLLISFFLVSIVCSLLVKRWALLIESVVHTLLAWCRLNAYETLYFFHRPMIND